MKVFDKFNTHGKPCPVCDTREKKPVVLVAILGTEEGSIMQAMQVHLDCMPNLTYVPKSKMIYGTLEKKDEMVN